MKDILTGVDLLRSFAEAFRSGAQGADMDCDAAKAMAEAIDKTLSQVDKLKTCLIASDNVIREVANDHNLETAEGRRISVALAKIIRENDAALSHTSTERNNV